MNKTTGFGDVKIAVYSSLLSVIVLILFLNKGYLVSKILNLLIDLMREVFILLKSNNYENINNNQKVEI